MGYQPCRHTNIVEATRYRREEDGITVIVDTCNRCRETWIEYINLG